METGLHRSISVVLALMVWLSTVSWTVEKHLCMGKVVAVSWFAAAQDCSAKESSCIPSKNELQHTCCADESFTLKGQDTLKHSWYDLDLKHQCVLVFFTHSYLTPFTLLEALPVPHEKYPPPILIRDLPLLDQVFLI